MVFMLNYIIHSFMSYWIKISNDIFFHKIKKNSKTNNGDTMVKEDNRKILFSHKNKFFIKFIVSIILNILLLVIPIYYSNLIDALSAMNFNKSYLFIIIFATLTIIYRIIEYFNQKAYFWLYLALYKSYMNLALNKTFNNSLYSLSRFSLSEYSNIMSEDCEMISDYYSTLVIRIVELFEFVYIIIYFFFINKMIGIITIASSIFIVFLLIYFNKYIVKTNIERKNRNDLRISLFQEIFLSIRTIKGFNILKGIAKRLNMAIDDYIKWHFKLNMNRFSLREIALGIVDIFKIISLVIGIKLIINGHMTLGTITIIYSYYTKLSELFISIITLSESINNKNVSLKRINKLFQYANYHQPDESNYNDIKGEIIFKKVLYGNKIVPYLNDVSFKINSNTLTVVSGSNTSCRGIFDLLLGYNRPHSGDILIDSINYNLYSRENISNNISFINEYPTFFNTSIHDNLLIFDNNFENIINVCKYLEIDEYIMKLSDGYETILYNNGSNIDNDIRYLLALAIVFLKKSKIILIDDIFSHISHSLYQKLLKMLFELKKEHTIIIISNDKKIIKNKSVDKNILISRGVIIGNGKYCDLMLNNQDYHILINKM